MYGVAFFFFLTSPVIGPRTSLSLKLSDTRVGNFLTRKVSIEKFVWKISVPEKINLFFSLYNIAASNTEELFIVGPEIQGLGSQREGAELWRGEGLRCAGQ